MATPDTRADLHEKKEELVNSLMSSTGTATELGKILGHVSLLELCRVALKAITQFQTFTEGKFTKTFSNQNSYPSKKLPDRTF